MPHRSFSPLKLTAGSWKLTRPTLNNAIATPEEFHSYTKELLDFVAANVVRVLVHHVAPFSEAGLKEALGLLTGRKTVGKLVVKVSGEE